ncbi:MAG: SpoIIE family protein phosphatase [Ardenticatenaceae bacterium]|nr:SpoIIE family protein phosphatase [Anaerolineales bacterium]MCB8921952.1 SpoIIE family protein phosphatase [Ardenticatenaceae bacterium]MCB8989528.1 SpoIIE family protein phosphatase [Ardenticatenaceae bacterium]MCB9003071.1 SpoIIE family protein phosphatase [Ardenticatenaceae bacterium]
MNTLSWPSFSFALLFASLALSSYVLWRRYQSRRLLMQRVAELEDLSAAGRAIVVSELDVGALCALIAQEAGKVIDNRTFQVGLFDGPFYEILFWVVNGERQPTPQSFDISAETGIVGWVRESKQALLVRDFQRELADLPATPRYISETPPRSAIFIPLISGESVLGIVAAQSTQPNRFKEEDLRRLMILANQAGAAIANAQLFEQVQMRAAHLELVRKIARQANAVQDLEEIFSQVVQLTQEMFGFHAVHIFGIDEVTGESVLKASSSTQQPDSLRLKPQQGIVGTAVSSRQTIIANNTREDGRYYPGNEKNDRTLSEIAVPLLVNERVLGVLDVHSDSVGTFTPSEQTVLEALAAEVASAIHQARQLANQQERAWLTTAQLQVAAALSSSGSLEEIVAAITQLTPILLGSQVCGLLLWDEEMGVYKTAVQPNTPDHLPKQFAIGDWPALDAVHVGHDMLVTQTIPAAVRRCLPPKKQHALRLTPLTTQSQMLGVMLLDEYTLTNSGKQARQLELLRNIAEQTGRALENAYLRLAQQEEAWVNTVLLQVAEAVNSRIDLNEILNTIVRLVPMLVGVESIIILIWDEERSLFHAGPSHGVSSMGRGLIETLEIAPDDMPILAEAANALLPRASYVINQPPPWLEKVLSTPTAHLFPLNARQHLVGVMLVGTNDRELTSRRLNILNGIAHQAATAVVNNHLYQEEAERDRLAQELHVAHQIQSSLIPQGSPDIPGCSVASFWQAARSISGDFYDFIPLRDGTWGIVIADVADKGIPAALFMALCRTILRTVALNRSDPAEVLMRVNEIIDSEAQSDLFVTIFYAVWHPQNQTLVYANGGHNPPMLLNAKGNSQLLSGNGMALGVLPDITIESRKIKLKPNDTLLFYTDGVTEAMNEDYDEFGMERMRMAAFAAQNGNASGIVEAITESIRHHAGETPQFDDITLVVLKRCKTKNTTRRIS